MKLQPGDYVSTEGMSEEQYHAVCKAFMDAGAGKYADSWPYNAFNSLGWGTEMNNIINCSDRSYRASYSFKRPLTIQQIIGEPEQMNLQEAYKIMQANCGIEVGGTVRVLRKAKDFENGWGLTWCDSLDKYVGKEIKVLHISDRFGMRIEGDIASGLWVPFFVLDLVKKGKKLPDPLEISSDKHVVFCEGGEINLGIHHLDFDKLEEIYLTAKGVKDGD